ncbi:hypothetical protein N183_24510 [Sinorhizobium sp. Sb3]|nr:hypothetical protein N183_24510 [Sinorhizobium sp. Sb3]
MLVALNHDCPLVGNCGTNPIRTGACLAPHSSGPEPNTSKLSIIPGGAASLECNAVLVCEYKAAAGFANGRE